MKAKQQIIESGGGPSYDWANDHICVKTSCDHAAGRVTMVEDRIKPGFRLARHYHKKMTEIFYVLEGRLSIDLEGRTVELDPRQGFVVPKGVLHRTRAVKRTVALMVENAGIIPTGN